MSGRLVEIGLTNAALALVLAILVAIAMRWKRNAHLEALLWLVVLIKFVTPPVLPYAIEVRHAAPAPVSAGITQGTVIQTSEPAVPRTAADFSTQKSEKVASTETVASSPRPAKVSVFPPAPSVGITERLRGLANVDTAVWIWLGTAVVLLAVMIVNGFRFNRIIRGPSGTIPSDDFRAEFQQLCRQMGFKSVPDLRVMDLEISPLIWNWWGRTTVLFPRHLLEKLSSRQRAMILVHELAHLQRHDHHFRWLEVLVQCLYWWFPPVYWMRQRLHAAQEECCDVCVDLHFPGQQVEYCESLLAAADWLSRAGRVPAWATEFGRTTGLKQRIQIMLQQGLSKPLSQPVFRLCLLGGLMLSLVSVQFVAAQNGVLAQNVKPQKTDTQGTKEEKPAPAPQKTEAPAQASAKPPAEARPAANVTGIVVDPEGKPVPDALLLISGSQFFRDYGEGRVPKTNADGKFEYSKPEQGSHRLTVFSLDWQLKTVAVTVPQTEPLKITLQKGKRVEFRAVDPQGKPVTGIKFYPQTPRAKFNDRQEVNYYYALDWIGHRRLIKNETNEKGIFVWENAPDEALGYQIIGSKVLSQPGGEYGPDGSPHTLTFRSVIPVSGKVVNAETGEIISSFKLYQGTHFKQNRPGLWSWHLQTPSRRETPATPGTFNERLLTLDRLIQYRVEAPGFRPEFSEIYDAATLPDKPISYEFRLKKDTGFSGVAMTPDLKPAAGAKVYVKARQGQRMERFQFEDGVTDETKLTELITTDVTGKFQVKPHADPFVVFISHESGYRELPNVELFPLKEIKLDPWGTIEGQIAVEGKPAANVQVFARQGDLRPSEDSVTPEIFFSSKARTDAAGKFRLNRCIAGEWNLDLWIDEARLLNGHLGYRQRPRLELAAGQTLIYQTGIEGADVIGRIIPPEGAQINWDGSMVFVMQQQRTKAGAINNSHSLCIKEGGSFRVHNLVPDDYEFHLTLTGKGDPRGAPRYDARVKLTRDQFTGKSFQNPIELPPLTAKPAVR